MARPGLCPQPPVRAVTIARGAAASAIIAGSAAAVCAERSTLRTGLEAIGHARPGWVAAGVALEFVSMAAFALLQQRLLKAAGAKSTLASLLATDYTSNAIAAGIPIAGSGLATATSLRQFRQHGIDPAAIRLTLGLAGMISAVTFAVIVAAGAVLTGNPAGTGTGLLVGFGSAAAVTLLIVIAHSPGGRARLRPIAASVVRLAQRTAHRPVGDPAVIAASAIDRVGSPRLGPWSTVCLLAYGAINWSADAFCLAAAIGAVGVPIPWDKLLLASSAGVGASSFSPTPFGLGVVDAALIAALAATGINSPDAVGAVLIYRVMTFKLLGLIWVLALHLQRRRPERQRQAECQ
jgi:putative heme transporter